MTNDTLPQIPPGYMEDAQGKLVPDAKVKPEHKLEDELVRRLCEGARSLNKALAAFKQAGFSEIEALRDLLADEYGAKRGGPKGNVTLRSYDGRQMVSLKISDTLVFGPELQTAKLLIDELVEEWSDGANDNLRTLIFDAFQVNKQNRIDTHRVLSLRRLAIDHPKWQKAMEAVSNAVRVHSSRTYLNFYDVNPETGVQTGIRLDLAGV